MHCKTHPWGTPPWIVDFRPAQRPLPDQVDFAIVGGGFTGLSAAAWLSRLAPGRSVLVLEAASLGEGASGRTGGLALAETAAGQLPGLGDVLAGYRKILRALRIDSRLALTGVFELGRSAPEAKGSGPVSRNSPISWNDSGNLRVVRQVPGGTVDPGKALAGLARAAERAGAQIVEHAQVRAIDQTMDFSNPLRLRVRRTIRGRIGSKEVRAGKVLLATNAFSSELSELYQVVAPKLTFAIATAPLSAAQLKAIGLASRRPFYTVDLPYLWGRVLESKAVIFGAGLVPAPSSTGALFRNPVGPRSQKASSSVLTVSHFPLYRFNVRKGEPASRLRWLESRVRNLHPALKSVRITHRWGGPILFTQDMRPIFRWLTPKISEGLVAQPSQASTLKGQRRSGNVMVLAGYNGHGVALSVYLGQWAAEALLSRRPLPPWY